MRNDRNIPTNTKTHKLVKITEKFQKIEHDRAASESFAAEMEKQGDDAPENMDQQRS